MKYIYLGKVSGKEMIKEKPFPVPQLPNDNGLQNGEREQMQHHRDKVIRQNANLKVHEVTAPIPDSWIIGEEVIEGKDIEKNYQYRVFEEKTDWINCDSKWYNLMNALMDKVERRIIFKPLPLEPITEQKVFVCLNCCERTIERPSKCSKCGNEKIFTEEGERMEESQEQLWNELLGKIVLVDKSFPLYWEQKIKSLSSQYILTRKP